MIQYTADKDKAHIKLVGVPSIVELTELETWVRTNITALIETKAVTIDLSQSTYSGSQLAGIVIGIGKKRQGCHQPIPVIVGASETVHHLFAITGTTNYIKFAEDL